MFRLFGVAVLLWAEGVSGQGSPLQVAVMPARLAVDPQTNTASATILITNGGAAEADLLIMADDFIADGSSEGMSAKALFGLDGETPSKPEIAVKLPAGGRARIRMEVSNLWQAGVARARLMNHAQEIAKIVTAKNQFAFNVAPLGWKGDTPVPLRFQRGQAPLLILKNDDLQSYDVEWSIACPGVPAREPLRLSIAGQSTEIISIPEKGWIPSKFNVAAVLKELESDATLKLVATDHEGKRKWRSRDIPLKVQRSFWSPVERNLVGFGLLALLVTAGGLTSLFLTHWVPNRLRRIAVRELIESASPKIRALNNSVHSSLRVGVRVERTRLLQRLNSRSAISPDFAALANECEAAARRLIRAIEILDRVGQLMRQIESNWPSAGVHGPTLLRSACFLLYDAQVALERPEVNDAIVAAADALMQQAEATIANAETLDEETTLSVRERVKKLQGQLKAPSPLGASSSLQRILAAVPDLQEVLAIDVDKLVSNDFRDVDTTSTKLDLVARFVASSELPHDSQKRDRIIDDFVGALRRSGFTDFRRAEALTEQIREAVFAEDVKEEIAAGRVSIGYEPQLPKVNQAVSFTVDFRNVRIHNAAARSAIVCEWQFDHAAEEEQPGVISRAGSWLRKQWRKLVGYTPAIVPLQQWKESGLSLSHYFPSAGSFAVIARFFNEDGSPVTTAQGDAIANAKVVVAGGKRRTFGERTKIETLRLFIVLLITVAGLLIGARDELAKLDLIPGLIAVFMTGFTADQIKNIIAPPAAQRSESPD